MASPKHSKKVWVHRLFQVHNGAVLPEVQVLNYDDTILTTKFHGNLSSQNTIYSLLTWKSVGSIDTYSIHIYKSLGETNELKFLRSREVFSVDNSVHNIRWIKAPTITWAHIHMTMEDKTSGRIESYFFE
jgi:hypothetical protein